MSAKTKIIVVRMKKLLSALLLLVLGIILISLLMIQYAKRNQAIDTTLPKDTPVVDENGTLYGLYIPGTYSTEIVLGKESVTLYVTVSELEITDISLGEKSAALETLYPLLDPTLAEIKKQLQGKASLQEFVSPTENRYTTMVLVQAIQSSLNQAKIEKKSD